MNNFSKSISPVQAFKRRLQNFRSRRKVMKLRVVESCLNCYFSFQTVVFGGLLANIRVIFTRRLSTAFRISNITTRHSSTSLPFCNAHSLCSSRFLFNRAEQTKEGNCEQTRVSSFSVSFVRSARLKSNRLLRRVQCTSNDLQYLYDIPNIKTWYTIFRTPKKTACSKKWLQIATLFANNLVVEECLNCYVKFKRARMIKLVFSNCCNWCSASKYMYQWYLPEMLFTALHIIVNTTRRHPSTSLLLCNAHSLRSSRFLFNRAERRKETASERESVVSFVRSARLERISTATQGTMHIWRFTVCLRRSKHQNII